MQWLDLVDCLWLFVHLVWGSRRCHTKSRILGKNRALQLSKLRARFDAKLGHEHVSGILIGGERIRLSSVTVEREHELAAQPLTQRMAFHSGQQLSNDRRVATEQKVGVDKILKHGKAQLRKRRCCSGSAQFWSKSTNASPRQHDSASRSALAAAAASPASSSRLPSPAICWKR